MENHRILARKTLSKRAEWERRPVGGTRHELRVGDALAVAHEDKPAWMVTLNERGSAPDVDHAKQLAEGKLREIRDALNEHFAPVLRWVEKDGEPRHVAVLGRWRLEASDGGWWDVHLCTPNGFPECRASWGRKHQDALAAKSAAEAALRALGVVFRTEDE